jgi:polyhydroxyalkanoate synthesis regulator phasin
MRKLAEERGVEVDWYKELRFERERLRETASWLFGEAESVVERKFEEVLEEMAKKGPIDEDAAQRVLDVLVKEAKMEAERVLEDLVVDYGLRRPELDVDEPEEGADLKPDDFMVRWK